MKMGGRKAAPVRRPKQKQMKDKKLETFVVSLQFGNTVKKKTVRATSIRAVLLHLSAGKADKLDIVRAGKGGVQ